MVNCLNEVMNFNEGFSLLFQGAILSPSFAIRTFANDGSEVIQEVLTYYRTKIVLNRLILGVHALLFKHKLLNRTAGRFCVQKITTAWDDL